MCSRVRQIQDLGHSKYKLRLFSKRTHEISKILYYRVPMNPQQALKAKLECALFLGVHNCKKPVCTYDGKKLSRHDQNCKIKSAMIFFSDHTAVQPLVKDANSKSEGYFFVYGQEVFCKSTKFSPQFYIQFVYKAPLSLLYSFILWNKI